MKLTKEYFDSAIANLVSKDDIKGLTTKDDAKNFATKDDLLGLATSVELNSVKLDLEELKELVTKIDARDLADSNAFKSLILGHGVRIGRLEKKMGIKVLARSEQ